MIVRDLIAKRQIINTKPLLEIKPNEIINYLISRGWIKNLSPSNNYEHWNLDGIEIVVPLQHSFDDYANRVFNVLDTLAFVEIKTVEEIMRALKKNDS